MSTFTPPSLDEIDNRDYSPMNPVGNRLMRYYPTRPGGATVYKLSDGTYRLGRQIPGLTGGPPITDMWPPVQQEVTIWGDPYQPNENINTTWLYSQVTSTSVQNPAVVITYYGGHSYEVSAQEAADLTAAGLGAYIT